ncbi:IS1634 family transposase [Microbacterium limosum]|uniref:IS1634 family transposase n=1 Tax=Microbacterium limosum TaxID=3079935 RepID=A0AAU0MEX7_9MICO|nr:IS1634 family transposase [Microbacterium sp. Y20]WOQ69008.1 IS1634 family transposase [Microbacterium sp. Y20]
MGLFVRKVRTSSGGTAVQIARKHRGVRTIVEHIGSAHDDAQLAALVQTARERITAGQLAFDLDALTPTAPTGVAPTVVGSRSRVLWELLETTYRRIGFDTAVDDDTFMKLVLARVVEPTSKADTIRVLEELGVPAPGLRTIWRTLARCVEQDWRDKLATAAYAHATRKGALRLVLYDVTTLYFEAEDEDALRKVGMSKERRVDPQVLIGMLVTPDGFPLEVHEFPGNTGETLTLLPVLRAFQDRHQVDDVVVVADAGMLSASNLNQIEDAEFSFIVGSRISKAPYDLAEHFDKHGGVLYDGSTMESKRVMGVGENARARRVVYHYSAKRDRRDNHTLDKQVERAQRIADGKRPLKKDRFVKLTGTRPAVDQVLVDRARQLAGLKGYVTNIPQVRLTGNEVVAAYHELFQVERSFRMAKTDLRARPMFHHEADSIHAHLTIVFTALAISRHLQDVTGFSIRKIIRSLRPLRDVTISIGGNEITATTPPGPEANAILTAAAGH